MSKKLIAITGLTGVGKTYLLKKYNYKHTIYLDDYVKEVLYKKGTRVFKDVVNIFGKQIVEKNKISTQKLGKLVINSSNNLEKLSSVINYELANYLESLDKKTYLIEIATYIKYESIFKFLFDKVILITSNNPNFNKKFQYVKNKVRILDNKKIKYDYLINRDFSLSKEKFFNILDKEINAF